MPDFTGLRAVAAAGASAIGLITARPRDQGAMVAVLDREPPPGTEQDHLHFVQADVTDDPLTRAMAADLLPDGICVNACNPGTADTPQIGRPLRMTDDPQAERAALEGRQTHGPLESPDAVAGAIAYLSSPAAGSVTGVALAVDGGMETWQLRSSR
jgi:NAD(P)-dependent dehydrogenase (short-subunit alcohol dehydrogenase family)